MLHDAADALSISQCLQRVMKVVNGQLHGETGPVALKVTTHRTSSSNNAMFASLGLPQQQASCHLITDQAHVSLVHPHRFMSALTS